jgi:3-hydroxybutyryl-CoA dehydrogenase
MAADKHGAVEVMGVVGDGFMGSGITQSAARAGVGVHLYEPDESPLQHSRERLEQSVSRGVSGGKLSDEEGTALLDRIDFMTRLDDLALDEYPSGG